MASRQQTVAEEVAAEVAASGPDEVEPTKAEILLARSAYLFGYREGMREVLAFVIAALFVFMMVQRFADGQE